MKSLSGVEIAANGISPLYYANALSTIPLYFHIITTFPAEDILEWIFNNRMQNPV